MKQTRCSIELEVNVDCPYCGMEQDIISSLEVDIFKYKQMDIDLDQEHTCEYCEEVFLIKEIDF